MAGRTTYTGDTITNFGTYLPTPIIERIKIKAVTESDPMLNDMIAVHEKLDNIFPGYNYESERLSGGTLDFRSLSKLSIDMSCLFNSNDTYDLEDMFSELFEYSGATGWGTSWRDDTSLYMNIIMVEGKSRSDLIKQSKSNLKHLLMFESPALVGIDWSYAGLQEEASRQVGVGDTEYADSLRSFLDFVSPQGQARQIEYLLEMSAMVGASGAGSDMTGGALDFATSAYDNLTSLFQDSKRLRVISIPLSDFFDHMTFTTDNDLDGNPIVKTSYINVEAFVGNFPDIAELTLMATISTKSLSALYNLSAPLFALNLSDISYEQIKTDGNVAYIAEPVFIDQESNIYHNQTYQALNSKFYKTESFGPTEISNSLALVLAKYLKYRPGNETLISAMNGIQYIIDEYQFDNSYLVRLNRYHTLFPNKSPSTMTGRLYHDFRTVVLNANSTLLREDEVVKRIFRNFKISDLRSTPDLVDTLSVTSYEPLLDLDNTNYLYDVILHSNLAVYAPIENDSLEEAGTNDANPWLEAEVSFTPSELSVLVTENIESALNNIKELLDGFYDDGTVAATSGLTDHRAGKIHKRISNSVIDDYVNDVISGTSPGAYSSGTNTLDKIVDAVTQQCIGFCDALVPYASDITNSFKNKLEEKRPGHAAGKRIHVYLHDDFDGIYEDCPPDADVADELGLGCVTKWSHSSAMTTMFGSANYVEAATWTRVGDFMHLASIGHQADTGIEFATPHISNNSSALAHGWSPTPGDRPDVSDHDFFGMGSPDASFSAGSKFYWDNLYDDFLFVEHKDTEGSTSYGENSIGYSGRVSYTEDATGIRKYDESYDNMIARIKYGGNVGGAFGDARRGSGSNVGRYAGQDWWDELIEANQLILPNGRLSDLCTVWVIERNGNIFNMSAMTGINSGQIGRAGGGGDFTNFFKNSHRPFAIAIARLTDSEIREKVITMLQTAINPQATETWLDDALSFGMYRVVDDFMGNLQANLSLAATELTADGGYVDDTEIRNAASDCVSLAYNKILGYQHTYFTSIHDVTYRTDTMVPSFEEQYDSYTDGTIKQHFNMPILRIFGYTPWKANFYYFKNDGFDTDSATADYADIVAFCVCLPLFDKSVLTSALGDTEYRVTGLDGTGRGSGMARDRTPYMESDRVSDSEFGQIGISGGTASPEKIQDAYGTLASTVDTGRGNDLITFGSDGGYDEYHGNYALGFVRGQWPYAEYVNTGRGIKNHIAREHNLAASFMHVAANYMISQRAQVLEYVQEILYLKTLNSSVKVDYGMHNILASTDILMKKSGYFFFDLEKFIRKGSVLSTVCDVDKLIKFMPSMNPTLNHAIQLYNVEYDNNTLSHFKMKLERALGPEYGGGSATSGFINFDFDSATTYGLGTGAKPLVYSKIERLNSRSGFTFKSFFNSMSYDNMMAEAATSKVAEILGYATEAEGAGMRLDADRDFNNAVNDMTSGIEYSHLVLRNYAFNEWSSYLLPTLIDGRKYNFRDDYRLLCFYYQYFIDDDNAFIGDPEDTVNSTDEVQIFLNLSDLSHKIMRQLSDTFKTYYDSFIREYYNLAIENCAYDKYNLKYNDFFIEEMLRDYTGSTGMSASPWYLMVSVYVTYLQIFTDMYGGSYASQIEHANNILDGIRPETGRLDNLIDFVEQCRIFDEVLEEKAEAAKLEFESRVTEAVFDAVPGGTPGGGSMDYSSASEWAPYEGFTANGCFSIAWQGEQAIKRPVIDHIADYTDAPDILSTYSEFGSGTTTDL
jgi:hypothetical protein